MLKSRAKMVKCFSPRLFIIGYTFNVEKHEGNNKSPEWTTARDLKDIISFQLLYESQFVKN